MSSQTFTTFERLRLEIEVPSAGAVNVIENGSGEFGGWGWLTPVPGDTLRGHTDGTLTWLEFVTSGVGPHYFLSDLATIDPGRWAGADFTVDSPPTGYDELGLLVEYLDVDGNIIGTSVQATGPVGGADDLHMSVEGGQAPSGAVRFRVRVDVWEDGGDVGGGVSVRIRAAQLVRAATEAETVLTSWVPSRTYANLLGPTHDIQITRPALDLGVLTATVLDATLDPATADTIRPGRAVRVTARDYTGVWRPIFTGQADTAQVSYDLLSRDEGKRARITLTAVDNLRRLSTTPRAEGVGSIGELPYVLEGARVPWNINGSGDQVAGATVVAVNTSASALDQVAITRDTALGYAWIDAAGMLQVWDAALMPATLMGIAGEDFYDDLSVAFNTEACINDVTVNFLRMDPTTGETTEVVYGPFRSGPSIEEWGPRSATFTIQGEAEETAGIDSYAATILAANATPQVRVNSIRCRVLTDDDFDADALGRKVFLDLYDLVLVDNSVAEINEQSRIVGLEHTITPDRWTIEYTFTAEGTVATPQLTPAPTAPREPTVGELLRPVGELTMWYGDAANPPAGWLVCDGSKFSAEQYARLADHLGGVTLPDMTDKLPVGAGVKSLGSKGGKATKPIAISDLPSIPVRYATDAQGGGGATRVINVAGLTGAGGSTLTSFGGGTALDVMPPWLALHFLIRAG